MLFDHATAELARRRAAGPADVPDPLSMPHAAAVNVAVAAAVNVAVAARTLAPSLRIFRRADPAARRVVYEAVVDGETIELGAVHEALDGPDVPGLWLAFLRDRGAHFVAGPRLVR